MNRLGIRMGMDMLEEWGFLQQFDAAAASTKGIFDYHEDHAHTDRHRTFQKVLRRNKVDFIERTMIIDLIEQDGQVIGAMGIHVQSGEIITIRSKATILCAGAGSYKPTGFPTGSCTFDGEAMGIPPQSADCRQGVQRLPWHQLTRAWQRL